MDAFTRMDLDRILWDLKPTSDKSDAIKDLDKAGSEVAIAVREAFSDALHNLEDARDTLDTDAPDGETVLSAIDKVLAALSAVEDLRSDLDSKLDALWEAEGKVTANLEDDEGMDPDELIRELDFRGYQIVKVPRNVVQVKVASQARPERRRVPRLRKVA